MLKSAELRSVCKDKTYEYLSRAICHPVTSDSNFCSSFCGLPRSLSVSALRFCVYFFLFRCLSSPSFICRKVKDSLPLFRQFFSSAFSLTYVSLASMKLPPDVLRCLYLVFPVPPLVPRPRCVFQLPVSLSLSLASPSCLHRALLTGLISNPHINDLHLDISGCEVGRASAHHQD